MVQDGWTFYLNRGYGCIWKTSASLQWPWKDIRKVWNGLFCVLQISSNIFTELSSTRTYCSKDFTVIYEGSKMSVDITAGLLLTDYSKLHLVVSSEYLKYFQVRLIKLQCDTYSVDKEDVVTTPTEHDHIRVFAWACCVPQPWHKGKGCGLKYAIMKESY